MGRVDTLGTFVLSCHHTISFRTPWPFKGHHVYCRRCEADRVITDRVQEFKIDCTQCKYHRSFGEDRDGAVRRASYHARNVGHDVTVRQGMKILETIPGKQDSVIYL